MGVRLNFDLGTAGNLSLEIKNRSSVVVATSIGGAGPLFIQDNGDGTYYCDALASDYLTVYDSGSAVDGLENFAFVGQDILDHLGDVNPHPAYVYSILDINGQFEGISGGKQEVDWARVVGSKPTDHSDLVDDEATKHRLINDAATGATDLWSASKIDSDRANSTGGTGLTEEASSKLAVDFNAEDMEIVASKLRIRQSFSSENFIDPSWSLNQNLSAVDAALNRHEEALQDSGEGNTFQTTLFTSYDLQKPPTSGSPINPHRDDFTNAAYYIAHTISFWKTTNMRQLAFYFKTLTSNAAATGYIKVKVLGDAAQESNAIDNLGGSQGIFYKISTLANNQFHTIEIWGKVTAGYSLYLDELTALARYVITTSGGSGNYAQDDPVD